MKILLLEPFLSGSHKKWAEELKANSQHEIAILGLSGSHWKWRMHGAAITLAELANNKPHKPNLLLASDMLDLSTFLALTKSWSANIPTAVYFHENQLNYPWSPDDVDVKLNRDNHYAFINYTSALCADEVFFNSEYHMNAFLNELPSFLKAFPDNQNLKSIDTIKNKSSVLPLGLDLKRFDNYLPLKPAKPQRAVILWNHRWEYDKNPERFFHALFEIADRGIDFRLIVLGENYGKQPRIFDEAKKRLFEKILHWGYVESFEQYCKWLAIADLLPVTSNQDFFGISVIEAMYCNVVPFFPKRLAYPEHIPTKYHSTFFYDEPDFVDKLQKRIWDIKYIRVMDTRQYAIKYDWNNLIDQYDRAFTNLGNA